MSKDDSWWKTLKEGGTITSGKAGITNKTFGGKGVKPKKMKKPKKVKKPKEEEYPIIPEEDDFWRD